MILHLKLRRALPVVQAAGCAAAGLGVTLLLAAHGNPSRQTAENNVLLTSAAYRVGRPETAPTVGVSVDATKTQPCSLSILRDTARNAGMPCIAVLEADAPPLPDKEADWFAWGRMAGRQAGVTLRPPAGFPANGLSVYAVAGSEGAATLLVNRSGRSLLVNWRQRLPAGVYRIERLSFAPVAAPVSEPAVTALQASAAAPALSQSAAHLVYLEGCDFAAPRVVSKTLRLAAGESMLVRADDVARAARLAFYETYHQLDMLHNSASGPANRLKQMLREGESYLGGVNAGGGRRGGLDRRLGSIHRLLLVTAQAESLHRNYLARNTVKQGNGAGVMHSLEQLADALAATSATLLGLVPQIDIQRDARGATVTLSLLHAGSQGVDLVKLGMDSAALPGGVTLDPNDPAFFGELHPGQSVEAKFRLKSASPTPVSAHRCVAEISYVAAHCPARLRLRAW